VRPGTAESNNITDVPLALHLGHQDHSLLDELERLRKVVHSGSRIPTRNVQAIGWGFLITAFLVISVFLIKAKPASVAGRPLTAGGERGL
jgi:hypothetical protein